MDIINNRYYDFIVVVGIHIGRETRKIRHTYSRQFRNPNSVQQDKMFCGRYQRPKCNDQGNVNTLIIQFVTDLNTLTAYYY